MAGNGNSGRRPKPTALKVFEGWRADRINRDEPAAAVGEPERPTLSPTAAAVWLRESPRLVRLGVLTEADGRAFGMFCELCATADLVAREKSAPDFKPLVMSAKVDPDGHTHFEAKENPLLRMERQTAGSLKAYLMMFGLEPSTRSRLKVTQGPPEDKLRAFLSRGHRRG